MVRLRPRLTMRLLRAPLTFAPHSALTQVLSVPVADDTIDEADNESLELVLSNPNSRVTLPAGARRTAANIADNDPAPGASVRNAAATEGDNLVFEIWLTAASGRALALQYETATDTGGSNPAVAGTDYTAIPPYQPHLCVGPDQLAGNGDDHRK